MQFNKSLMTAALLAAASLTAVSASAAGTATGAFKVLLQVDSACTVNAAIGTQNNINFGTVNAGATPSPAVATSSIPLSVQCSKASPYAIALTPVSTGNKDGTGEMKKGTDKVAYSLFSDLAATTAWGSLETNDVEGTGEGNLVKKDHAVFAKVTGSTDVPAGNYEDTVNVAVTY